MPQRYIAIGWEAFVREDTSFSDGEPVIVNGASEGSVFCRIAHMPGHPSEKTRDSFPYQFIVDDPTIVRGTPDPMLKVRKMLAADYALRSFRHVENMASTREDERIISYIQTTFRLEWLRASTLVKVVKKSILEATCRD